MGVDRPEDALAAPVGRTERGAGAAVILEHRTVLYVEDNRANFRLMERIVAHRKELRLIGAERGRIGLEMAGTDPPDLILLDLHLPDISGQELLDHLKDDPRTAEIPVVIVSADATPGQIDRLLAAGAQSYFDKTTGHCFDIGLIRQHLHCDSSPFIPWTRLKHTHNYAEWILTSRVSKVIALRGSIHTAESGRTTRGDLAEQKSMDKEIILSSRILIVDDQTENVRLLERILRKAGYSRLEGITDSRKALNVFSEFQPDLVALDLQMPFVDGFALLKQLRSRIPMGAFVPILILTADNSRKAKQTALSLGAKDFLTKPFDVEETLLRIYNLLETRWLHVELQNHNATLEERVSERTRDLELAQLEILQRLALAAEYRDDCTGQHTQRVGTLAAVLARAIGLPADQIELIRLSAPLHDVGKIGIPDGVLLKPSKLTDAEYLQIKRHTEIGRIILSGSNFAILQMAERIALYHHERWDGNGYHRLSGDAIPLEARIVSVADVFDVITHDRPYKNAESVEVAIDCIRQESGKQFDPNLVDVFCQLVAGGDLGKLAEIFERDSELKVGTLGV